LNTCAGFLPLKWHNKLKVTDKLSALSKHKFIPHQDFGADNKREKGKALALGKMVIILDRIEDGG